jgi:predicted negative regulator of RcsB-dependent stress response
MEVHHHPQNAEWKGIYGILNEMGYDLLTKKNNAEAVIVFQLQTQEFPDDWDSFDSMGDGYIAIGDTANAIENYKKAIQLNASDTASKRKIIELEKGK